MNVDSTKAKREINISFQGKTSFALEHQRGNRKDAVMSQDAVTRELNELQEICGNALKRSDLQQTCGDSWDVPMSQWAVTSELRKLQDGFGYMDIWHGDLVRMREENLLVPGRRYRITDYETICDSNGDYMGSGSGITVESAGHRFDIIVTALTTNTLSENAQAICHEGDTYFSKNNLLAWELGYCLDNDVKKYKWATRNGKGVIYYMKDEFGNECAYDFKNIMYRFSQSYFKSNVESNVAYYTYSLNNEGGLSDFSLGGSYCHNNVMESCKDWEGKVALPANVFVNTNSFAYCFYNKIGHDSYNNTFGSSCSRNELGYGCYYNHFPSYYQDNIMGNNCSDNQSNEDYLYGNKFGNAFSRNIIEGVIMDSVFGNNCSDNRIYSLMNGIIGNNCTSNYLYGSNMVYEDDCSYNVFVTEFVEDFDYFNISVNDMAYCENIHLSGHNTNNVYVCQDGSVKNIDVQRYVQGSWEGYNVINVPYIDGSYEMKISTNSAGEVKIYCEADLISD